MIGRELRKNALTNPNLILPKTRTQNGYSQLHDSEQVGLMNMNVSRNGDLIFLKKVMPTDIGFPQRHENTSPNSTKPLETFTGVTVAGKKPSTKSRNVHVQCFSIAKYNAKSQHECTTRFGHKLH